MRSLPLVALVAALSGASLSAADWPAWRGPDRSGVSPEKGLLKTWPADGPKLLWKTDKAGLGYAGMAVVGDTVFTMGARGDDEYLLAFDPKGQEKWAAKIGPVLDFKGNQWSHGPNSTPTVDGDLVFALSSKGDLLCAQKATGEKVWSLNLPADLGGEIDTKPGGPARFGWGYCWSPLVDGDRLILTPGGPKGLFAAVDKKTGKVLWRSKEVTHPATYSSAVALTAGGVRQYVYLTQSGVVAVAAKDGARLWEYKHEEPFPDVVAPTPVLRGDQVYVTVGYGVGAFLLKPDGKSKELTPAWSEKQIGNKQGGVVLLGDNVFGYHEDRNWACQEFATGKVLWPKKRTRQKVKAGGVVAADGKLFTLDEDGTVALLDASPRAFKVLASFRLPQESAKRKISGKPWTHPSLSNGRLYVRDQELLYCFQVK